MADRPVLTGFSAVFVLFCVLASLGSSDNQAIIEEIGACRMNMMVLATAESMYYGVYDRFPDVIMELDEFCEKASRLTCPEQGVGPHLLTVTPDGDHYTIECPDPQFQALHGSIDDGIPSWD